VEENLTDFYKFDCCENWSRIWILNYFCHF